MVLPDGTEMPGADSLLEVVPNHRLVFTACCCPTGTPPSGPGLGFTAIIPLTTEGTGIRYTVRARHRSANQAKAHADTGCHDGRGAAAAQLDATARSFSPFSVPRACCAQLVSYPAPLKKL